MFKIWFISFCWERRQDSMKKSYKKVCKLIALAAMLPFLYGCGSGAGVGSLVGFLFGAGGFVGSEIALLSSTGSGSGLGAGGAGLATLHQPEPATMLLMGGGLMAMSYFKSKTSRRS